MRIVALADNLITDKELKTAQKEYAVWIESNTGEDVTWYTHRVDYSNVPTESDSDGDLKPSKSYTTNLMQKEVYDRYGTYGSDSIVLWVHRDNWIFKGIWGTNWSNIYRQYHVHLCRFDNVNAANTLGTLNHEVGHSFDALIKTHTGFDINVLFKDTKCYVDYDSTVIHGNRFHPCKETPFKYIRWKENADSLQKIAPHLRKAYAVRKELYLEPYKQVQLKVISWLRSLLNSKNGVPKGT